jgi:hypothetical protein
VQRLYVVSMLLLHVRKGLVLTCSVMSCGMGLTSTRHMSKFHKYVAY